MTNKVLICSIVICFFSVVSYGALLPASITSRNHNLESHVEYLSSMELGGRVPASRGDTLARNYIASHYSSLGLAPVTEGGYFQYFQFLHRIEEHTYPLFNVISDNDTTSYEFKRDFVADPRSRDGAAKGEAVFIGYGIHDLECQYNDFDEIDLKNKIVFCFHHTPKDSTDEKVRKLALANSYAKKTEMAALRGAAAFIYVMPGDGSSLTSINDKYIDRIPGQHFHQQSIPIVRLSYNAFRDMLKKGDRSIDDIKEKLRFQFSSQAFQIPDISVSLCVDIRYEYKETCNIIGMIEGHNTEKTIIIGAHYDHIGHDKKGRLRLGANDNASGVAVLIELASLLSSNPKPDCNYLFVAFGMEEWGCVGSKYFIRNMPDNLGRIKAMINLDMVGTLRDDSLFLYHLQSAREWPTYIELSNNNELNIVVMPNRSPSDSGIFNKNKIPTLFLYTGPDEINDYANEYLFLNYDGMEKILDFTFKLARLISSEGNKLNYLDCN